MTPNKTLAAQIALTRAHSDRQHALDKLRRAQMVGNTRRIGEAERAARDATHRLMVAERDAARVRG